MTETLLLEEAAAMCKEAAQAGDAIAGHVEHLADLLGRLAVILASEEATQVLAKLGDLGS